MIDKWFILQNDSSEKRTLINQPDIYFEHHDPFAWLRDHDTFTLSMERREHDNDISLYDGYYAHTQTLYQVDSSHLLVGITHKDHLKKGRIAWALEIAYIDINKHKYSNQLLTDNKTINPNFANVSKITKLDSILPSNQKLKRTEIAITPDRKYLLVCDVSDDNIGYFGLYDLNIILKQLANGIVDLANQQLVKPVMVVPNITYGLPKKADFINIVNDYEHGQKNINKNYSIQGYAIDNDLNIYIDSQRGPIQKKKHVTPYLEYPYPYMYKLKYGDTSLDQAERISLNELKSNLDYDILHSQLVSIIDKDGNRDNIIIDSTASELEGIQVLDSNRLYIVVTYHEFDTKTKNEFDRDQLIQIAW